MGSSPSSPLDSWGWGDTPLRTDVKKSLCETTDSMIPMLLAWAAAHCRTVCRCRGLFFTGMSGSFHSCWLLGAWVALDGVAGVLVSSPKSPDSSFLCSAQALKEVGYLSHSFHHYHHHHHCQKVIIFHFHVICGKPLAAAASFVTVQSFQSSVSSSRSTLFIWCKDHVIFPFHTPCSDGLLLLYWKVNIVVRTQGKKPSSSCSSPPTISHSSQSVLLSVQATLSAWALHSCLP